MFAGVGERTREGNDLYKEMTESVSVVNSFTLWSKQVGTNCILKTWIWVYTMAVLSSFHLHQGISATHMPHIWYLHVLFLLSRDWPIAHGIPQWLPA